MLLQAAAEVLFTIADPRIDESSGLAASRTADAYYTVDDSGRDLRYFVLDGRGRTVSTVDFPGVDMRDVEDLALGPDSSLYLGDIGDNAAVRPRVLVHRTAEPRVDLSRRDATVRAEPQLSASLTYEDGPRDAETLLVHPRTGQVLVVTKGVLGSSVYAAPQPLADGLLRRLGNVRVRVTGTSGGPDIGAVAQLLVTGGAVSPDGSRVVLRTYTDAYVYEVPGDDVAEALQGEPTVLPLPETDQGEAVAWTRDGAALLTSSEGGGAPVHRVPLPGGLAGTAPEPADAPSSSDAAQPSAAADRPAAQDDDGPPRLVLALVAALVGGAGLALSRRARRR